MKKDEENFHGKIICEKCKKVIKKCDCEEHQEFIVGTEKLCENCKKIEKFSFCSDDERLMRAKEIIEKSKGYLIYQLSEDGEKLSCVINTKNITFAERFGLLIFANRHSKNIIKQLSLYFSES